MKIAWFGGKINTSYFIELVYISQKIFKPFIANLLSWHRSPVKPGGHSHVGAPFSITTQLPPFIQNSGVHGFSFGSEAILI